MLLPAWKPGRKAVVFMTGSITSRQPNTGWEHFPHVADVGIRGFGPSIAVAFEQAALAMTAIISPLAGIRPEREVEIHCEAPDTELLLVDWLNAVIFEMDTRKMLFCRFDVITDGRALKGRARGERIDVSRHQPATEVKGATFSELEVTRRPDGAWLAQCIVDV